MLGTGLRRNWGISRLLWASAFAAGLGLAVWLGLSWFLSGLTPSQLTSIMETSFQTVSGVYEGAGVDQASIEESLARAMLAPTFPVALSDLRSLRLIGNFVDESQILILDKKHEARLENVHLGLQNISPQAVQIHMLRNYAHPNGVNVYRISWQGKTVVYATDTESYVGGDTRLIAFSRDADLLIHDAQYSDDEYVAAVGSKQGWGHSTHSMALAACKQAGVKMLAFFHHDPLHSDEQILKIEQACQREFPNSFMAREGLTVTL